MYKVSLSYLMVSESKEAQEHCNQMKKSHRANGLDLLLAKIAAY